MSIPNNPGKHGGKAVIEPAGVIIERKNAGLYPTTPVPTGAVICYDSSLWQWICSIPGRVDCDGWLKGSYLLKHNDALILVIKAAGFGAPTAVLSLEELAAYGIKMFIKLGINKGILGSLYNPDLDD